jgi:hypothetical protein
MAYGALVGNALGGGLADLSSSPPTERRSAAFMLPLGVGGLGAGAWSHAHLSPTAGDWTMVGVGTGMTAAQIGVTSFILDGHGLLGDDPPIGGIVLTGTSLASTGFMATTPRVDPDPLDSLVIASTTAWGAIYGGVGQIALDTDLDDLGAVTTTTVAADLGLGIGAAIVSDATSVTPRDTFVPQLFGVAGATLGSLGVMLATEEAQPIAIGSLAGATAGLVTGAVVGPKIKLGDGSALAPRLGLPDFDPPGDWAFQALPAVQSDGKLGAALSLSAAGL